MLRMIYAFMLGRMINGTEAYVSNLHGVYLPQTVEHVTHNLGEVHVI